MPIDTRPATAERRTAVHEAGHAVAAIVLSLPLEWVDLDRGMTRLSQVELPLLEDISRELTMGLAARAAEEMIFGEASNGCQIDLQQATARAIDLHTRLGMGIGGLVSIEVGMLRMDDALFLAIKATLTACYVRALLLVRQHRVSVERVADALVTNRFLDASEIRALYRSPLADPVRGTSSSLEKASFSA
jgi:cell division protease FtsH